MIVVNRIANNISVSCRNKEYDVVYTKEKFDELIEISKKSTEVGTLEELETLLVKVEEICKNDFKEKVESFHPEIYVQPISKKFYLKVKDKISKVPMPEPLIRRIQESMDKSISVDPIIKLWKRFLRNPKAGNADFARRFCEYIDMIYVRPDRYHELLNEGLNSELATELASTYEVKVTEEGLIACYKVSTEIEHKFVADENGEPKKVNRYTRTFDENTGKITGDNRNDIAAEERLFEPKVMGNGGDAFYCEGPNGFKEPGHFIRIGCVHRLPDWSYVNCNDRKSCVKGLHVGGLGYISTWGGDIHTCLVDPMHIGAIPDYSGSLAIRVLQYYVYGSLSVVNHSIYHSSTYAAQTDKQWEELAKKALEEHGELEEQLAEVKETVKNL